MSLCLKIFDGETLQCRRVPLQPGQEFVVGSDPGCDVVINRPGVAARHLHFRELAGRWVAARLGTPQGILLNGEKLRRAEIKAGDFVHPGPNLLVGIGIVEGLEHRDSEVERQIALAPDDRARRLVLADRLHEHADPLAAVLSEPGRATNPKKWLEGLERDPDFERLTFTWKDGLIDAVTFRWKPRRPGTVWAENWKLTLTRVLHLSAARFLKSLQVQLLEFIPWDRISAPDTVREWAAKILKAPAPFTLSTLDLGYAMERDGIKGRAETLTDAAFPVLKTPQFVWAKGAHVEWLERSRRIELYPGLAMRIEHGEFVHGLGERQVEFNESFGRWRVESPELSFPMIGDRINCGPGLTLQFGATP